MGFSMGSSGFPVGSGGFLWESGDFPMGGGGGGGGSMGSWLWWDFLLGSWGCVGAFCGRGGWLGFPQGSGGCGVFPMGSGGCGGVFFREVDFPPCITFQFTQDTAVVFPCETGFHGVIPKEAGVVVGFP